MELIRTATGLHAACTIAGGGVESRIRLGLRRVLSLGLDCAGVDAAWHAKASGKTFLLCVRVEEIRTSLGPDDSCAATPQSNTSVGGGLEQSHRAADGDQSRATARGCISSLLHLSQTAPKDAVAQKRPNP